MKSPTFLARLVVLPLGGALLLTSGDHVLPSRHTDPGVLQEIPMPRQKITTFLWYDDDAEEAVRFYTSIFADSQVLEQSHWGPGGPVPEGTLMTARFTLAGQEFVAMNAGPEFPFTEAISLMVNCESQREIDDYWEKLLAGGGTPSQCGWLKDRFGLSWQVTPTALLEMIADTDRERAQRVFEVMLGMQKLDLARLRAAYEGR